MKLSSENKAFATNHSIRIGGKLIDFTTPKVMGILNLTPDSFYDGGKYSEDKVVLNRVEEMISEGTDIIDIGGQSSKPRSDEISYEEEKNRILPHLKNIRKKFPQIPISIDTYRSQIAEICLDHGANIINDISSGRLDTQMTSLIASRKTPYIIMHMQGMPKSMQDKPHYQNVVTDVFSELNDTILTLREKGIEDIIIDPGFGFGKTLNHNYELLKNLGYFNELEVPILVGLSRKSMIYNLLDVDSASALNGSTVANTIALLNGASILRVHDVKEAKEAIRIVDFLQKH